MQKIKFDPDHKYDFLTDLAEGRDPNKNPIFQNVKKTNDSEVNEMTENDNTCKVYVSDKFEEHLKNLPLNSQPVNKEFIDNLMKVYNETKQLRTDEEICKEVSGLVNIGRIIEKNNLDGILNMGEEEFEELDKNLRSEEDEEEIREAHPNLLIFSKEQSEKIQDARKNIEDIKKYAIEKYKLEQKPKITFLKAGLVFLTAVSALYIGKDIYNEFVLNNSFNYTVPRDFNADGENDQIKIHGNRQIPQYSIVFENDLGEKNILFVNRQEYEKRFPKSGIDFDSIESSYKKY